MRQAALAAAEFKRSSKPSRRAAFLARMVGRVVVWRELCGLIELVYPKPGKGRSAV